MPRWIATLALAEALTMTSGVFLLGSLLLATSMLLTCNLLDEIAAKPASANAEA